LISPAYKEVELGRQVPFPAFQVNPPETFSSQFTLLPSALPASAGRGKSIGLLVSGVKNRYKKPPRPLNFQVPHETRD
jgi:hypothetical protein